MQKTGFLQKMKTQWDSPQKSIEYFFRLNDSIIPVNEFVGKTLSLTHTGSKQCVACGRSIKKTFQGGYCFPCTKSLAETDLCIVKPELCHFHKGTCRDEAFGQKHCFIPHCIYLAVTSGAKVGITREHQKLTRWADQGARYALEILHVPDRKTAGEIEVFISQFISDKTNWRKMLQGEIEDIDLYDLKEKMITELDPDHQQWQVDADLHELSYPVMTYPDKIKSYNFDKTPEVSDTLKGIKGQYLIFENAVMNVRKFSGYEVELKA